MMKVVVGCVVALCLWQSLASAAHFKECSRDSDCFENSYCDQVHHICELCVPCQDLFNRGLASDQITCARTEDDCGACLPGYRSEDLTGQRRSFKCYPAQQDQEEASFTPLSSLTTWSTVIAVAAAAVVVAAFFTAFATYYVKINRVSQESSSEENRKLMPADDRLPPPYDDVSSVRASDENYTVVPLQTDVLNGAAPVGRYHVVRSFPDGELDPEDLDFGREQPPVESGSSLVGSTETIPSLWEPRDDEPMMVHYPRTLLRSQSLPTFTPRPVATTSISRSCPDLSTLVGVYNYHILLATNRNLVAPVHGSESKYEGGCRVDPFEPLPPESFSYEDQNEVEPRRSMLLLRSFSAPEGNTGELSSQQGSQDSGFFGFEASTSASRRRPANEEVQFGLAVYIKRSRQQ